MAVRKEEDDYKKYLIDLIMKIIQDDRELLKTKEFIVVKDISTIFSVLVRNSEAAAYFKTIANLINDLFDSLNLKEPDHKQLLKDVYEKVFQLLIEKTKKKEGEKDGDNQ
jgi:hypothetical protein